MRTSVNSTSLIRSVSPRTTISGFGRKFTNLLLPLIGVTLAAPAWSQVIINEIDYDQSGADTSEFVEIMNTGASSVNLAGWTIELVNGIGSFVYQDFDLPAVSLAAGDYFVVCGNAANTSNCDLDVSPDTNLVQNGAPDGVGLKRNGTLVDAVSYEGDLQSPYIEGSGAGLEDNSNDVGVGISRFPDGIDTDQNNVDFSVRCITPGEANIEKDSDCVPDIVFGDGFEMIEVLETPTF